MSDGSVCSRCGELAESLSDHLRVGCGMWLPDLHETTVKNTAFRKVLLTTPTQQLTVMHLKPGEDIGTETHRGITQSVRVEKGKGWASVTRGLYTLEEESWLTIPPGAEHNVWADEDGPGMWLYSILASSVV